jgi:hypothetical protein
MQKQDDNRIKQEFKARQSRQIIAMAIALFLVLLSAVVYKRPDLFGAFSKSTLFGMQAITIAAFIVYTVFNWRCPSCNKGLGNDLFRLRCRKCGTRLQ